MGPNKLFFSLHKNYNMGSTYSLISIIRYNTKIVTVNTRTFKLKVVSVWVFFPYIISGVSQFFLCVYGSLILFYVLHLQDCFFLSFLYSVIKCLIIVNIVERKKEQEGLVF